MKSSSCIFQRSSASDRRVISRGDEGPEFVDANDPRSLLEAAEEAAEVSAQAGSALAVSREDVSRLFFLHLFGDDPHPARVLRRLWLATVELAPQLAAGVSGEERTLLADAGEAGHAWRVGLLLRGTRFRDRSPEHHNRVIREALADAYRRKGHLATVVDVPLGALSYLRAGETLAQFSARNATIGELLRFLYVARMGGGEAAGNLRPERAVRMAFLLAKALHEDLILHMSLQHLGDMFGEERATWSHRGKHKLAAFLAARGALGFKACYQKSEAACAHYAAVQRGNRNRIGLPRRAA